MESAIKTIKKYNLIESGDTIAIGVSGGSDSMCLLDFLNKNREKFGIKVLAVNVDHMIRESSKDDTAFVDNFCKEHTIQCLKFKVDVKILANEKKLGIEEAARMARYKIFESIVKNGIANKVAIAHHQSDQAETILLNIFRGAGLKGASGMEPKQGSFIRPFINTTKNEILQYIKDNQLTFVTDETNQNIEYSRNFIRNEIMPKLKTRWKNVENNIINFAAICKQDNEYIDSTISFDDIEIHHDEARIPLYKFASPVAVQNRILRYCFSKLGLSKDIEKRHLTILRNLINSGKSGSKINLPNKLNARLEYDELVLATPKKQKEFVPKDFKTGKTNFENFDVKIKKTSNFDVKTPNSHVIDAKLLPNDVKWRVRQNGDIFAKFGSGTKKLKEYFIDKKVPNTMRNKIPVLASGNEIFCILGFEISEKVKATENTKYAYVIQYQKK